jgi:CO/xanthine dehydrogenase FAD-binding subunit
MVSAYRPESFKEALRIRRDNRVVPLAGGTDLMVKHRRHTGLPPRFEAPVLFLGHLRELQYITLDGESLVVGAGTTLTDLLAEEQTPPALREAIAKIASPAIRNVATLAGNVCNASPAGDTLPALYCLDALLLLARDGEERLVNIEDFILGPGTTDLRDDELLKSIRVPLDPFDVTCYHKVGTRGANALSKLSFLGLARLESETLADVRVAFGAVAPIVVRSRRLESECVGRNRVEMAQWRSILRDGYGRLIVPIDDQRSTATYRKAVCLRLLDHFLTQSIGRMGSEQ